MRPRDFLILVAVYLTWGLSNVVSKIVVGHWQVPPLFFAAVRFALVVAVTWPWLQPMPRPHARIVAVGLLMGGGNVSLHDGRLADLAPTMLALMELPQPKEMTGKSLLRTN